MSAESNKKHLFIVNPTSFVDEYKLKMFIDKIESYFKQIDSSDYCIHMSKFPRDAIGIIRKFAYGIDADTIVRVYAVGGDGVLFDCVNGAMGLPNAEIAHLPYGRTSDFISCFGKNNVELFKEINLLTNAPALATDVIDFGGGYALNFCSLGTEAFSNYMGINVAKAVGKIRDKIPKFTPASFIISGAFTIFNQSILSQHYKILVDGKDISGKYATINIANGPYCGGGLCMNPDAVPDDGYLDVIACKSVSTIKAVKMIGDYLKGGYAKHLDYFTHMPAKEIVITSDKQLTIDVDGEIFFDAALSIKILPSAIKFVAPSGITYKNRGVINNAP
jgi:diacylglycerol kinase family enzyme